MKKLNFILIALLFSGGVLLLTSCDKPVDQADLIGSWRLTAATFNPAVDFGSGPVTDAYPVMLPNACSQDDLSIFEEDGTYIDDEGGSVCNVGDPQQEIGTYTYSDAIINLYVTGNDTITITGVEFDDSYLYGTITVPMGGNDATVDITLTRQ